MNYMLHVSTDQRTTPNSTSLAVTKHKVNDRVVTSPHRDKVGSLFIGSLWDTFARAAARKGGL